jgi:glyoxylase-like metal-dependent hydrolase (beta-lactamase superfamily II)
MQAWNEHGDGVFSRRYRSLDLNIGAIVCSDGVVIIDTRADRVQARRLADDIGDISRLPVRWVVNTHHHWDHTFGNCEFADAAIWGHTRCAQALIEHGETMRSRVKELAPDHADEFDRVEIVPPTHTFPEEVTVSFGGRTIEMRHLGRGHTDNDIVVRVLDADVVFAGDLVEEGAPPAFGDSFPLEWPDTASSLLSMVGSVVVPGHGASVDAAFVAGQQAELAAVADLARRRHADGMTPEQAAAEGGPFPEASLTEAFARAWQQMP